MYTSYSTLQRKQLTKQVYTDTQSTYLLVYAPGRHQALEHALENQLHRKFRLVTELAPALPTRWRACCWSAKIWSAPPLP